MIGGSEDNLVLGWLVFSGFSVAFALVASAMTVCWGPGANGSGVVELIAYLNGINCPGFIGFETFVTKVFGVVFAVTGGLCVGKEGPLAHVGGCIGAAVAYLWIPNFAWFRNDTMKRKLIAAGASAGVSAAFGAPVGGTLFAFEISKPNIFWKFSVIWKVFMTCALSVFMLAVVQGAMAGQPIELINSSVLKFGVENIKPSTFEVLPGSFITGAICGVMGATFVLVNSNLGLIRKKYVNTTWKKLLETCFFSLGTTSCFYFLPILFPDC